MANLEHLAKLGEGIEAWNVWRQVSVYGQRFVGIELSKIVR
jgi:hypothetical protein